MRTNILVSIVAFAYATSAAVSQTPPTDEQLAAAFIASPPAVESIGMRTVWQTKVALPPQTLATRVFVAEGDSVFVADSGAHLARVLTNNGLTVWQNACGRGNDRVHDVDRARLGSTDEVLVTLDTAIAVLDTGSGTLSRPEKLERIPTTESVLFGKFLIFGAKGGFVAWQQYLAGCYWKSNELGGVIKSPPILVGNMVAVASTSGQLALLEAETTRQVWRKKLGGPIEGRVAAGAGAIFAACGDHTVHAYEITGGALRWRYMTESPLSGDVFCDGEFVYTQVPGQGLVALTAVAPKMDSQGQQELLGRDGRLMWKSSVQGNVICRVAQTILVWDAAKRILTALHTTDGSTVATVALPRVVSLTVSGSQDPDLYLLSADGTMQRCEARVIAQPKDVAVQATAPTLP